MKNHDKLATRLAQILYRFNNGEKLKLEDLANEFEISQRTLQRDLKQRLSFLPIKNKDGQYFLEEFYLGKYKSEDLEKFAIFSGADNLYPKLDKNTLEHILDEDTNKIYKIQKKSSEELNQEDFKSLEQAILNQNIIEFFYKNKQRETKPYKLLNADGIWYLCACEDKRVKTFSLALIEELKVKDINFIQDKKVLNLINESPSPWINTKSIEVTLEIKKEVANFFTRRKILPKQQIIKRLDDGGLIISARTSYEKEILRFARYWIPNVQIISPNSLRQKLKKELVEYLEI